MTWVTLFPLRSAAIGACTPRHFCFGATPFSPLKLRGLAKSKMPSSRGKNGGHSPLERVTHVIRLSHMPVWRTDRMSMFLRLLEKFLRAVEKTFAHWSVFLAAKLGELLQLATLLWIQARRNLHDQTREQIAMTPPVHVCYAFAT